MGLFATAGCDRLQSGLSARADEGIDAEQEAAQKNGKLQADAAVREARIDALEARVSVLENQADSSEDATQDTRLDMVEQQMNAMTSSSAAMPVAVPVPASAKIAPSSKSSSDPSGAKPTSDRPSKSNSASKKPAAKADSGPGKP
ncbi:MAG: hypothetical protein JWO65_935 [Sphingomonas bacterium]|nr:hypothetical protein [Sphingomonas bacterium]